MAQKSSDTATIREVYALVSEIERKLDDNFDKIDKRFSGIEQRVANIEGRASILALAWSSLINLIGIAVELFLRSHR